MNYDPLFPSVVGSTDLEADNKALLEYCLTKQKESEGRVVSNLGGWQSNDLVHEDWKDNHAMSSLFRNIEEQINQYRIDNRLREDARCFISNWWININYKNATNGMHVHPYSAISGVYYVKCNPEVHPGINFRTPLKVREALWGMDVEPNKNQEYNHFTARYWAYSCESGKLLLFPSWLEHGVGKNLTDDIRVSISFNAQMKLTNAAN